MVTPTGIEIGKSPYVAEPWEIIQPGAAPAERELEVGLVRKPVEPPPEPPSPIPSGVVPPGAPGEVPGKKRLILNIETTGYRPWEHRIIAIGYQDPMVPNTFPTIIMLADEAMMIATLFAIIRDEGYNELIGYGLSFDYRFLLIKAMKYNIDCKEFYDMELYDLMQAAAQGKFEFMYKPQSPPSLSDLADYLWGYPKPFTDLEMIKYYAQGQFDKVLEFASSQITRILALYSLFRKVSENPFTLTSLGIESIGNLTVSLPTEQTNSKLTIPEAHLPETVRLRCGTCMAEDKFPKGTLTKVCSICGGEMKPI